MESKIKKYTLKNGIKVIIVPLKTKMTYISMSILLGSYHEKKGEGNLTHYYEHLLGRLTSTKYKDYMYVGSEIVKRGGFTNAFVNNYQLCVFIKGFYEDFEFYIDILSNSLNKFYIDPKIANNEKGAVMQELRNTISRENYDFDFSIFKYLYPKYYYLEDTKKDIKYVKNYNIKLIKQFIKNKIFNENIVVNVSCPENKVKKTMRYINKYFGIIKKKKKKRINYPVLNINNNKRKIIQITNKRTDENTIINIYTFMNIKFFSKEHLINDLLEKILFNFELGVFYRELREKTGLIYSIKLYNNINIRNPIESYCNIVTKCNLKNVPIVISKIISILKNYKISDEEIAYAKRSIDANDEYDKFFGLESYNNYENMFLLYNIPYKSKKDLSRAFQKLKNSEIRKHFESFKNKIIKTSFIFYYSSKNINNNIKNSIDDKIIN
jgi:predicted Zn-dependent peptidase